VPKQSFFGIGLGMVAPTIKDHAQPHVRERYLPAMYRADIVGCQLFSEPGAGSDLAGLQTRAERDGDEWVLNGQKVWTSGAHYSDIGEIICRTDPDQPKHKGLTGFVVDMHAPGVEVAAAPDDRRRQLQRGVLHRCAGPRRPPPRRGQRGLERRPHHADERAGLHRQRQRGRGMGVASITRLSQMRTTSAAPTTPCSATS
jgi:hypothetical protein